MEYISALCINTGANTFKANQYSNILDLSDRKKEYKDVYDYFGEGRYFVFLAIACIYLCSLIFGFIYLKIFKLKVNIEKPIHFIFSILIRSFCKSMMPMYFITNSIIILLSIFFLKKNNIFCFDKSRLLNSGSIDTIFFSKTGTLCYNNFQINSFNPAFANPHKPGVINIKNYQENQSKEINYILEKYYQDYFNRKQNNYNYLNSVNVSHRHSLILDSNNNYSYNDRIKNQLSEYTVLFIECLLSCNNLEKFGTKIFGNIL